MSEIILNINDIIVAVFLGLVGSVYINLLVDEDGILEWYYKILDRIKYKYISASLGWCEYCMIGQIALWLYLIYYWNDYNLIKHIFFIILSIFFVFIFNKIIRWSKN